MTTYPAQIDNSISLPEIVNKNTTVSAESVNKLKTAIIAVQTAIGANPGGIYGNLRTRLEVAESTINSIVGGGGGGISINGDIGGTSILPKVIGIQGISISNTAPTTNQVLSYNGSSWAPATISTTPSGSASGDLGGTFPGPSVIAIRGISISASAPTTNDVLQFNGSAWAPTALSLTLAGDVTGAIGTNTVVSLTGTGGVVTGPSTALTLGTGSKSTTGLLRVPYSATDAVVIARRNAGDGGNEYIITHAAATTRMWSGSVYGEVEAASGKLGLYAAAGLAHFASLGNTRLMLGAGYATIGNISIPNSGGVNTPLIAARNAGGTGDMTIASYNTTTAWAYWGDTTTVSANAGVYGNSTQFGCAAGGTHKVYVSSTEMASIGKASGDHIDLGATPASTGIIRISNNTAIKARNAADNADLPLINSLASDGIEIGTATGTPSSVVGNITIGCAGFIALRGGGNIYNQINGNDVFTIGAGYVSIGTGTLPSTGAIRLLNNYAIYSWNGAANSQLLNLDGASTLKVGDTNQQGAVFFTGGTNAFSWYCGATLALGISLTALDVQIPAYMAKPILGNVAPYSAHGGVSHTFASDADYTVTAAQYKYDFIRFETGSWTAAHQVIVPGVASMDLGYYKTIHNNTAYNITVTTGAGATVTISGAGSAPTRVWVDNTGVYLA